MRLFDVYRRTKDNRTYTIAHRSRRHRFYRGYYRTKGQNRKYYSGTLGENVTLPNWKLVSKQRKQWMEKPLRYARQNSRRYPDEFRFKVYW